MAIPYSEWRDRGREGEAAGILYLWARPTNPALPFKPGSDCSGFAHWWYGIYPGLEWVYPQTETLYSRAMDRGLIRKPEEARPGDMLHHRGGYMGSSTGHVGMYVGDEGAGPRTIEAHSSHTSPQVGSFPAFAGRTWEFAIAIDDIDRTGVAPTFDLASIAQAITMARSLVLKVGAFGPAVLLAQERLKIDNGERALNGQAFFGPDMDRYVRAFQGFVGLPVDGEIGPRTWAALFGERS